MRTWRRITDLLGGCVILSALALGSCAAPGAEDDVHNPQVWVDSPLNNSTLPLGGEVRVVWHAAAVDGVQAVEFGVNDAPVELAPPGEAGAVFVMGDRSWTPPGTGTYLLHVRAQAEGGAWSQLATSLVRIVEDQATPPSPTAEATASVEATQTATPTPEPTATATLAAAASIERLRITTDRVSYEIGRGCAPTDVTIMVRAVHPSGIQAVILFFRLRNQASGEQTEFFSRAMNPLGGDLYEVTINPGAEIISLVGFPGSGEGVLQHQAVIQTMAGDTSVRTPLLSDITVTGC